jgi:gamma-glutamyltranspeptidase/glutathione hydrolase
MTKGIVAAGSPEVAAAAAEVLRAGGNAFDAAIAAAWVTFVAETSLTSAGGAGFLMAHTGQGERVLFDFFSQTPKHKKPEEGLHFYPVTLDYGGSQQVFHAGLASVAIPGNVAGLFHVHKKLGTMPFRELVQPAIALAKNGVKVTPFFEYCAKLVSPTMTSMPFGKSLFMPDGKLPQAGELFRMPDFANTMEYLALHGPDEFYRGEIARRVAKDSQEMGGYLTMDDFEQYEVVERKPLIVQYRGHEVCTNPPPSAGGTLIAFTLGLLEQQPLSEFGFGSPKHLQALVNAMRLMKKGRRERLDPDPHRPDLLPYLFDKHYVAAMNAQLEGAVSKIGSTTHFTVADEHHNIAAMTSSTGEGSGYGVPGTGIMFNNMLGEEDLNPQGFHKWPADRRITSMMAPTMLFDRGKPLLATGTGGANRIRSVITQLISNTVDFGMGVDESVHAPRVHWEIGKVDIEPGFPDRSVELLHSPDPMDKKVWASLAFYFGGAHTVGFDRNGNMQGAGDSRRIGTVLRVE